MSKLRKAIKNIKVATNTDDKFEKQKETVLKVERKLNSFGITNIEDFVTAIYDYGDSDEKAAKNLHNLFPHFTEQEAYDFLTFYSWE